MSKYITETDDEGDDNADVESTNMDTKSDIEKVEKCLLNNYLSCQASTEEYFT